MEKITYGAPRLVDWVAQIKVGSATLRIHFTGGALTSYGITPAEYTTANPFIQRVIEQSNYFKEGRIIHLRRMEIADTGMSNPMCKAKFKAQPQAYSPAESAEPVAETQVSAVAKEAETAVGDVASTVAEDTASVAEESREEGEADADYIEVSTTCLPDAQAYLQEKFGISSYKIRSYEAAQRAASEHGIRFVGARFGESEGNVTQNNESIPEE